MEQASGPTPEPTKLAPELVTALLGDGRFATLVTNACASALQEIVLARLVKEITLETVVHYGAIEKMDRGHQVWQAFAQAGVAVSLKTDGTLRFQPEDRLTPALNAIAEVHYFALRDHVRNLRGVREYKDTLEAELWPRKSPLGLLADLRGAGLSARLDGGSLRVGPPAKMTPEWKQWIDKNKAEIVRELQAEQQKRAG